MCTCKGILDTKNQMCIEEFFDLKDHWYNGALLSLGMKFVAKHWKIEHANDSVFKLFFFPYKTFKNIMILVFLDLSLRRLMIILLLVLFFELPLRMVMWSMWRFSMVPTLSFSDYLHQLSSLFKKKKNLKHTFMRISSN